MEEEIDTMADVYGELNDFDKRFKGTGPTQDDSSSEDGATYTSNDKTDPTKLLQKKNELLMERLFKAEKQLEDMQDTYKAISSDNENLKDKKIVDLVKRNKQLHI